MLSPMLALAASLAFGQDFSLPQAGYVNDFASLLPAELAASLEQKLKASHERNGVLLLVVSLPSAQGLSTSQLAARISGHWGLKEKSQYVYLQLLIPAEKTVRGVGTQKLLARMPRERAAWVE